MSTPSDPTETNPVDGLIEKTRNAAADATEAARGAADDLGGSGTTDTVAGRAKGALGSLTGDDSLQAEGRAQEVAGQVKDAAGQAADAARDAADSARHAAADAGEQVRATVTELRSTVAQDPAKQYGLIAAGVVALLAVLVLGSRRH